jgi:predicted aconitase
VCQVVGDGVPILTGIAPDVVDEDRLKALGATAASSSGLALFHVAGVTPEAVVAGAEWPLAGTERRVVTGELLRGARETH